MKKSIVLVALGLFSMSLFAQTPKEGLKFTTVKEIPVTSVKNQNRSSTCWSFSGLGFLEAELIRLGKGNHDLSEMFIVHKTMQDRAVNYVRYHGDSSFSPGGSFYDIIYCLKNYGLVPQETMPGIMYGEKLPVHNELDAVAEGYVKALVGAKLKKLNPIWKKGLASIYDTYLGVCPEKFTYEGKEYTPKTYAESLGLNADDYISLTSYTHHPFYTQFALEIQDNWRNALSYNLPINEFIEVMENAVNKGYTFAWGSDVSEAGFTRDGVALMTQKQMNDLSGSDMARWTGTTFEEKKEDKKDYSASPFVITQEMRQEAFDNWETTDDHGMIIYGLAKDQHGKEYFVVKNSWGETGKYKGIWYAAKDFVAYKTMNIVVHKDALPKHIAKKLGIKK